MKIELVSDTYTPDINGAALTLGRLTHALIELGHEVTVIHTGTANNSNEISVSGFRFPLYRAVKIGFPQYFKLRKRWKSQRPDAVYFAMESMLGYSAMKAARSLNIPVVAGFHTNFHQYLKKYIFPQMERPTMAVLRKIHNSCDATFVPSTCTLELLKKKGFNNLSVIGRGVNTALFSPSKRSDSLRSSWKVREEDCAIIIVGRIAKEKNLLLALESISELKNTGAAESNIKTIIVGEGPLRKSLEAQFSGQDFHWAGLQKDEDLAQHYASADVMLFTSETETFGNVIPEALASGLITVAYDYAAARDLIEDGENGYTAALENTQELKSKLLHAVKNKSNQSMRTLACKSVSNHRWKDIAQAFAENLSLLATKKDANQ